MAKLYVKHHVARSGTVNTAGQLTTIIPPPGGAVNHTYTGTGEGQRVGAGSTKYQYDGTGLNVQTDSANNRTYFTSLPGGGSLSETIPSGLPNAGTYYYLDDGAGNVAAVVDSTGAVRNSYSYDPFGAFTVSGSQQVANPFTFQAWMFDSQTGYYYTGSDYYDPATGQSFGCTDKGSVDPGEDCGCPNDSCGEDENPACGGVCSRSMATSGVLSSIGPLSSAPGGTVLGLQSFIASAGPRKGHVRATVGPTCFFLCIAYKAVTVGWMRGTIRIEAKLFHNGEKVDETGELICHHSTECSTPSVNYWTIDNSGEWVVEAEACGPGGCVEAREKWEVLQNGP